MVTARLHRGPSAGTAAHSVALWESRGGAWGVEKQSLSIDWARRCKTAGAATSVVSVYVCVCMCVCVCVCVCTPPCKAGPYASAHYIALLPPTASTAAASGQAKFALLRTARCAPGAVLTVMARRGSHCAPRGVVLASGRHGSTRMSVVAIFTQYLSNHERSHTTL